MRILPRLAFAGLALALLALSARADDYPQGLIRERLELAARGVEADLSRLKPGEMLAVEYVGRPLLVYRRTSAERTYLKKPVNATLADPDGNSMKASIEAAYESSVSLVWARLFLVDQPPLEKTPGRSKHEEFLVVAGWGPTSGCRLERPATAKKPRPGVTLIDSCGKGEYDAAGRALGGKDAPAYNLYIPPHRFTADRKLVFGLAAGAVPPELDFSYAKRYRAGDPTHDLIIAARYDDADTVEKALAGGADVNGFRVEDGSPIDAAIIGSRIETVKLLLDRGAQPTARSMRAAEVIGRKEVWEMLEALARKKGSR